MSSLRNAVQRRNHRERGQLASRERLGLLEKHKDYVLRARDYHKKQNALKTLRQKAAFRNPDEFYFGMINAKTKKGVHIVERQEKFEHDFLRLLKTQDQNYVNYQRSINGKKIERLKDRLHMLEGEEEEEEEEEDGMELGDESDGEGESEPRVKSKPRHTIFVDDEAEAKAFDPSTYFDTPAELLHRKFNRPTTAMLKTADISLPDPKTQKKLDKQRESSYRELSSRLAREEQLRKAQLEMELQKNLMGKGAKKKVGVDQQGLPVYKWKAQRKK
ncbi:rRNA-processing protein UTP11 [Spizellomyces punctatus DAOM BR117]|uniref:U3 small nucleolar RNA-associated protein 11 n=1 Tax=Spizellomyces punctatus (strain DAOM BR117) TaxID=645134 RepID=A0A0L0H8R8_SPIPD|nr:rRNA-processing protein UTP11 [Spizellomyces punctatus DAOM BR117]KNC97930.1 hypothetical protein SPPG_06920 [Spizellomyces punctatus DAOM BR117]|eukprot:XP_016605970.1 hypothetical protein SPPG_06920 [Spizellomyces punctatus DAOM BR117]